MLKKSLPRHKKKERTQQYKNERVGITIDFPDIKSIINEYFKKTFKKLSNLVEQMP